MSPFNISIDQFIVYWYIIILSICYDILICFEGIKHDYKLRQYYMYWVFHYLLSFSLLTVICQNLYSLKVCYSGLLQYMYKCMHYKDTCSSSS